MKCTDLPAKGEEVHGVVQEASRVQVPAVDVQGPAELLGPGGLVGGKAVQVGAGQSHQSAQQAVELCKSRGQSVAVVFTLISRCLVGKFTPVRGTLVRMTRNGRSVTDTASDWLLRSLDKSN